MKTLLLLLLNSSLTLTQGAANHTCRILFLNGASTAPKTLTLFDGAVSQEVELPRLNLSPVYRLRPGPLKLVLLKEAPTDPKAVPEEAPSVIIPETLNDFYLIVTTDRTNEVVPVRMQAVNANADRISPGDMLWFNLTQKMIAGDIGTEKLRLKPTSHAVVKRPVAGKKDHAVNLFYLLPDDDFVYPLCKTRWRNDPRSRKLVFIYDENRRRAPRVSAFTDFRVPEKKGNE